MATNCAYGLCKEKDPYIVFVVTHRHQNSDELETKNYCSEHHLVLGVLQDATNDAATIGRKNVVQAYKTAVSMLSKLMKAIEKEWQKAA